MPLTVIGTGFGRTGTDSMREALTLLGFGPCHHMFEVLPDPVQIGRWRALVAGGPPDWESLFEGYRSCVDWPSAYYWRDLIAAYPEARVILTWRSAESWWASFEKTLLAAFRNNTDRTSLGNTLIANKVFGGRPDDRDHAISVYNAHVAEVKATVPPERLLVHDLGDGWAPLCAHLRVAVPDQPYPQGNAAEGFAARLKAQVAPGAT